MDGRKEDNLEWWLLRDSGLLSSVIENHNRLPSRFVAPAAGNSTGQLLSLPQNQSARFRNGFQFQNPNHGDSNRFQLVPVLGWGLEWAVYPQMGI
nr:putative pumilio homolog 8, chloroplastic [Ipomoea batatas]